MKVGVIHFDIAASGGAEFVCLNAVKALHESNFKVGLCDINQIDYAKTQRILNIDIRDIDFTFNFNQPRLPFFQVYQRLSYGYFSIKKLFKKFSPNLVFVTYYPISLVPEEYINKTVIYVHYPMFYDNPQHKGEKKKHQKFKSAFKKFYLKPIDFLFNNMEHYKNVKLIANSKFTTEGIKKRLNKNAPVIYPPCPLYLDLPLNRKKNWVCSIGRFSPGKRYDVALEIAKKLPEIKFHFVGTVVQKNRGYLESLMKQAKYLDNVHFHINCPHQEKLQILSKSKVLLHCLIDESFGIVFPESMSSGTIPVCHDSGGPKVDGFVPSEFRWQDKEDAINIIQSCMHDWTFDVAQSIRKESTKFGKEKFQENIVNFVREFT
jgi:glycosyltransferase involved in cell wall biosynthesis